MWKRAKKVKHKNKDLSKAGVLCVCFVLSNEENVATVCSFMMVVEYT